MFCFSFGQTEQAAVCRLTTRDHTNTSESLTRLNVPHCARFPPPEFSSSPPSFCPREERQSKQQLKNKSSEINCFLIKHHFLQSVQPEEPCGGVSVSLFVSSSFDVFSCSTPVFLRGAPQWTRHANTLLDR